MTVIERIYPDPIPVIHPLPEYRVTGQRAIWYAETKEVLQVPWMGVVTMAYSHYPNFFGELWRGLKPLCRSRQFVEACKDLRTLAETQSASLSPKSLIGDMKEKGYADREIEDIRQMNTIFSHGNQPYVVISAITRHLLEIGDMAGGSIAELNEVRHAPDCQVPFLLMEEHHVDQGTRDIYQDIRSTLRLPFVNTDYRAFARWPSYFALAWDDLGKQVGMAAHEAVCQTCHNYVARLAKEILPNPGALSSGALCDAARADGCLDEVIQMCRLFQWLLPGLITNVAFMRHQLEAI
jgi:hypothetical protein